MVLGLLEVLQPIERTLLLMVVKADNKSAVRQSEREFNEASGYQLRGAGGLGRDLGLGARQICCQQQGARAGMCHPASGTVWREAMARACGGARRTVFASPTCRKTPAKTTCGSALYSGMIGNLGNE